MPTQSEAPNLLKLFETPDARLAQKALDALDGDQEKWVIKLLSDPEKGRKEWRSRGIIPRFQNITRMIVEKSGLLFSQNAPHLELYAPGQESPDLPAGEVLLDLFEKFDWVSFFSNFDTVLRLIKTALVLVQWDPIDGQLVPSILTPANCFVQTDKLTGQMQAILVKLAGDTCGSLNPETGHTAPPSETVYLRMFTSTYITDLTVDENGKQTMLSQVANPFGIIPVAVFHDTLAPRSDRFWNQGPHDLMQIQEMVNLHYTDSEYAATFSKMQALYVIDADINEGGDAGTPVVAELYGSGLPRLTAAQTGAMVGPGSVVSMKSNGGTPSVQFLGPSPDLEKLDTMFQRWVAAYAHDWSVNITSQQSDSPAKSSGFQLIVESADNLQLRARRQKMMVAGFRKLFDVIKIVVNTVKPGTFADDLQLFIEFAHPRLPVEDITVEENGWNLRIQSGRASIIDYFVAVQGLSRDEAIAKAKEVAAVNAGNLDYKDGDTVPGPTMDFAPESIVVAPGGKL